MPKSLAAELTSTAIMTAAAAGAAGLAIMYWWDTPIGAPVSIKQKLKRMPYALPILGDTVSVLLHLHEIHDYGAMVSEKNNNETGIIKLPLTPPIVMSNDPKIVEHVLKTKFVVYDKNFKEFVGVVFADELQPLYNLLNRSAQNNEIMDLQETFFRFTLDSFCKIGFGINLNCLSNETPVPFAKAFDQAQGRMMERFVTPAWELLEAITPLGYIHRRNVKIIRDFGMEIVKNRRREIEEGTVGDKSDLLTLMMGIKSEDGKEPSDEQLCDYVVNFIIAGRDTTAQALSWCFYLLHQNPHVLKRLLQEIDTTLDPSQETASYEQIKNMSYANAVFHETLRLYPSVPMEIKQANTDDILPDGTLVPKGALVSWSPYAMGRLTSIWGSDAKEFKPERWLMMDKLPSNFDYPVFNAGPRICLGKSMAELEGVFVLVGVLRRFKVLVVKPEEVTYSNSLTLPMKSGLKVKVERR
ncbi:Protein kinase alk2 [Blyttiomyces sp. JEL0837]|nr:Protein kinase alk2 [Blyttiomyces sp. JEL0837]